MGAPEEPASARVAEPLGPAAAEAAAERAARAAVSPREAWIELAVVLLVCVLPWARAALATVLWRERLEPDTFLGNHLPWLVWSVGAAALVAYLIRRSGEPARRFGLTADRWVANAVVGIFLALGARLLMTSSAWFL